MGLAWSCERESKWFSIKAERAYARIMQAPLKIHQGSWVSFQASELRFVDVAGTAFDFQAIAYKVALKAVE